MSTYDNRRLRLECLELVLTHVAPADENDSHLEALEVAQDFYDFVTAADEIDEHDHDALEEDDGEDYDDDDDEFPGCTCHAYGAKKEVDLTLKSLIAYLSRKSR